ncbi:alpha/beta hydrolase [Halomonas sp. 328]|uniref:alpha/beta hydrolase n=1 Tax=Halomonas sp. 328 TaxID=2776704 RepID=UPI0018A72BB7|nr:alpha/beta hydrolase fold domain-containing protein [Halomonas sp. 328]MBF8223176.1 alpha/beta hydrolase fold domain-containing protein [Halomonas sp. 328]
MEVEAFIRRFATGLSDLEGVPPTVARPRYEALCAGFAPADPPGLRVTDTGCGGVAVRRFLPDNAGPGTVLFVHGGGWSLGSVKSHHGVAASLAEALGREVISIDYRLAPEADYTIMLADCRAVAEATAPQALVGDSAGGRLVLNLAWEQARPAMPLGLIYPPVGNPDTVELGPDAPLLSRDEILALWRTIAPDLPPAPETPPSQRIEVLAVEHDPLTRPLEAAVAEWRRRGARVGYRLAPEMVHGALHAQAQLAPMGEAWRDFCRALARRLDTPPP